jgi:ankyrin repeat protein
MRSQGVCEIDSFYILTAAQIVPGYQKLTSAEQKLFRACIGEGGLAQAKEAIAEGASIKAVDGKGEWALSYAITREKGQPEIVKYLIEQGADVRAAEASQLAATPYELPFLSDVASKGWIDIAQTLLDRGADIHATDTFERTALHFAAERGTVEMVEFLLSKHANINAVDVYGNTPLMVAVDKQRLPAINYLLKHGASLTSSTPTKDVLSNAISPLLFSPTKEIIAVLIEHGAKITLEHLAMSAGRKHINILSLLKQAYHMQQMLEAMKHKDCKVEALSFSYAGNNYCIIDDMVMTKDRDISLLRLFTNPMALAAIRYATSEKGGLPHYTFSSFFQAIIDNTNFVADFRKTIMDRDISHQEALAAIKTLHKAAGIHFSPLKSIEQQINLVDIILQEVDAIVLLDKAPELFESDEEGVCLSEFLSPTLFEEYNLKNFEDKRAKGIEGPYHPRKHPIYTKEGKDILACLSAGDKIKIALTNATGTELIDRIKSLLQSDFITSADKELIANELDLQSAPAPELAAVWNEEDHQETQVDHQGGLIDYQLL